MNQELDWLAAELGLPLFEEVAEGVRFNDASRALLGDSSAVRLEHAVALAIGVPANDPELSRAIARARAGERSSSTHAGFRVLCAPTDDGRVRCVCMPSGNPRLESLERRAAAADAAAAVAHEVANALGAIMGWASIAQQGTRKGDQAHDALSLIESSARDARSSARLLLEMVHDGERESAEPCELGALLTQIERLIVPIARRSDVDVQVACPPDVWVEGPRARVFSIAWNLVQNAIEALPPGGTVAVTATASSERVSLVVQDDGPGIADPSRVFEPYFTTKPEGTGLGLHLVKRAAEDLGGNVRIDSGPDEGARFVVEVPRTRKPARVSVPKISAAWEQPLRSEIVDSPIPGARILVVDDDAAMCELLSTALALRGATTLTASSAKQALAIADGATFDLALVDFGLRDARGDALVSKLRALGAVQSAALISGASSPPEFHPGGEPDAWVRKPFELEDLIAAVSRLLRARAAAHVETRAERQ